MRFEFSHEEVRDGDGAETCARFWVGSHRHLGGCLEGDLADLELPASQVQRSPREAGGLTPAQPPIAMIARWSKEVAGSSFPRKTSRLIVAVSGRAWYVLGATTPSVGSTAISRAFSPRSRV